MRTLVIAFCGVFIYPISNGSQLTDCGRHNIPRTLGIIMPLASMGKGIVETTTNDRSLTFNALDVLSHVALEQDATSASTVETNNEDAEISTLCNMQGDSIPLIILPNGNRKKLHSKQEKAADILLELFAKSSAFLPAKTVFPKQEEVEQKANKRGRKRRNECTREGVSPVIRWDMVKADEMSEDDRRALKNKKTIQQVEAQMGDEKDKLSTEQQNAVGEALVAEAPSLKKVEAKLPSRSKSVKATEESGGLDTKKSNEQTGSGKHTAQGTAVRHRYFGNSTRIPDQRALDAFRVISSCRGTSSTDLNSSVHRRYSAELSRIPKWMWTVNLRKDFSEAVSPDLIQDRKSTSHVPETEKEMASTCQAREVIEAAKVKAGFGKRGYSGKDKHLKSVLAKSAVKLDSSALRENSDRTASVKPIAFKSMPFRYNLPPLDIACQTKAYRELNQCALSRSKAFLNCLRQQRPRKYPFSPASTVNRERNTEETPLPPLVNWKPTQCLSFSQKPHKR